MSKFDWDSHEKFVVVIIANMAKRNHQSLTLGILSL